MGSASSVSRENSPKHHVLVVNDMESSKINPNQSINPSNFPCHHKSFAESFKTILGYHTPRLSLISNVNASRNVSITSLNVPCHQGTPYSDYRILKKIANGGFSVVHKAVAINDSHKRVAIKENDLNKLTKKQIGDLHTEINILSQLSHPGIVKFYSVYMANDKIYMIMECLRGGELLDAICDREYYTEGDARRIMLQIVGAVDYLHSRKVIHRDIKLENIILESNSIYSNVKLVDFGFAILSSDAPSKHAKYMCGTPGYLAPEVLKEGFYSTACDVWSIGIMLYILLSGAMPFDGKNESRILAAKYPLPAYLFSNVSTLAKDLIGKILIANPSDRYSALQVLHHPWMQLPVSVPPINETAEDEQSNSLSSGAGNSSPTSIADNQRNSPAKQRSPSKPQQQHAEAMKHHPALLEAQGNEELIHQDIDISGNLAELRRLHAAQRWRYTIHKIVQSVRQQRSEASTPRTEHSSTYSSHSHTYGITPRTVSGSAQSSIRTMGCTPRSTISPRTMTSPRSFLPQDRSNSGSNNHAHSPWGGRMIKHQSSDQGMIEEEVLEDDEYTSACNAQQPIQGHSNRHMMTHMPCLPDDSEHDGEDSHHATPRRDMKTSSSPHDIKHHHAIINHNIHGSPSPTKLSLIQPHLVSPDHQLSIGNMMPRSRSSSHNSDTPRPDDDAGSGYAAIAMPAARAYQPKQYHLLPGRISLSSSTSTLSSSASYQHLSSRGMMDSGYDSTRQVLAARSGDPVECEEIT